jgi:hypothetical protein
MKIKRGVPIPPHKGAGRPREHKFEEMEVNDCAEIESSYQSIYGCIGRFKMNREFSKWEFRILKKGAKKVEVWRVK